MKSRQLNHLLREAGNPSAAEAPQGFTASVLSGLHRGGNPWQKDWRRFLLRWVPLGLLLVILLALAVALLPHGEHEPGAPATPSLPGEEP